MQTIKQASQLFVVTIKSRISNVFATSRILCTGLSNNFPLAQTFNLKNKTILLTVINARILRFSKFKMIVCEFYIILFTVYYLERKLEYFWYQCIMTKSNVKIVRNGPHPRKSLK